MAVSILPRSRTFAVILVSVVLVALTLVNDSVPAFAGPVADSDETYAVCGRVFPDPQAYWIPSEGDSPGRGEDTPHPGEGTSPFAKGNAPCAARTFMTYREALAGLNYLDKRKDTGPFIDVIDITKSKNPRIRSVVKKELGDGWTEGLPTATGDLDQSPLYLIKVTAPNRRLVDGVKVIPEAKRDHFVWSLSMHGIERAGVEGGVRAIEDLATWGARQPRRPLLETYAGRNIKTIQGLKADNLRVGEVLMRSVSYFILSNPDGWRRGDPERGGTSFMRYNGNGMDLNRDWPELGYTEPEYTPWSESESRTYGKVLQNLTNNWTGGIDLHGMVAANAFSYTLVGGSQRPFDKNERVMQFVEQAWDDAERRLLWSPIIKPNDAPDQCAEFAGVAPTGETNEPPDCDQRSYGVQYGTIWDTIEYTVTGAVGNWIDSPIGLNADGIDNEMMMSHLGNCGTGTCYVPDFEQLHVDGNKSLIYAMLNFSLQPPPAKFDVKGNVGYFVNPRRLVDRGTQKPSTSKRAKAPKSESGTTPHAAGATTVLTEFKVDNKGKRHIGGIAAEARWTNAQGESHGEATNEIRIQYKGKKGEWKTRPVYSSGAGYRQAGHRSDWNYPEDGNYRVVITGAAPVTAQWQVDFSTRPTWEQPIQKPFNVSNMDFFAELDRFVGKRGSLTAVDVDRVLSGKRSLADFDSIVIADDALLPGYREKGDKAHQGVLDLPNTTYSDRDRNVIASRLNAFVRDGGNLVLSDDALRALEWMGLVPNGTVDARGVYAGNVSFTTDAGQTDTYGHKLAKGIDRPGAAEGINNRRQVVEPVPLGYQLGSDFPQWNVSSVAWKKAGGKIVGTEGEGAESMTRVSLGELKHGKGRVRILGSFLTFPTTANYHPFGLASYSVTDNGYILARNMWSWENPSQASRPDLHDDPIKWVKSDRPTQKQL